MSNPRKAAGTAWETQVVAFLKSLGIPGYRKAQSGARDTGDIGVMNLPDVTIEAKRQKKLDLAGWVAQANAEAHHAGAAFGVVWAKRWGKDNAADGYVIMDGQTFADLLLDLIEGRDCLKGADEDDDY